MRTEVQPLLSRSLAVAWATLRLPDHATTATYNDAGRRVMRELDVEIADVQASLLPGSGPLRHDTGGLTSADVGAAARTLARAIRAAILRHSSPWAELPVTELRNPSQLLLESQALTSPMDLPEAGGHTSTVYRGEAGEWQFNLHSYLAFHEGKFWAIWSSGHVDEDGPSQLVRYATSPDGHSWSEAGILVADPDGPDGPLRWMANGLYVENGRLYALANRNQGSQRGTPWLDARLYRFEWTGQAWREESLMADDCLVYFPPLKVAGRDFVVWRNSQAHFETAYRGPGELTWHRTRISGPFPAYRLSESSHFVDNDGVVHLIIRDQGRTGYLYHAVSYDAGGTWTLPVKTNYPDAVSKNFAGRLSNGWFYLINNPKQNRPRERDPLAISFSRDGWSFGQTMALRKNAPALRFPGKAKEAHSFQYAHAIEHGGKLWVIYATNKEDIEISSFEFDDLGL